MRWMGWSRRQYMEANDEDIEYIRELFLEAAT